MLLLISNYVPKTHTSTLHVHNVIICEYFRFLKTYINITLRPIYFCSITHPSGFTITCSINKINIYYFPRKASKFIKSQRLKIINYLFFTIWIIILLLYYIKCNNFGFIAYSFQRMYIIPQIKIFSFYNYFSNKLIDYNNIVFFFFKILTLTPLLSISYFIFSSLTFKWQLPRNSNTKKSLVL